MHHKTKGNVMAELMSQPGRKASGAVRNTATITRRFASASLALVLLSGAGIALSAASVNAEVTQSSGSSAKATTPDVESVILYFKDGHVYPYGCYPNASYTVNAKVEEAHNGCDTRVWLKGSGVNWCISPVSASETPNNIVFQTLWISENKEACP
jgi:hypothetical protein